MSDSKTLLISMGDACGIGPEIAVAAWAAEARDQLAALPGVKIVTEPRLSLFSFALGDDGATEALLSRINDDGRIYLTQTRVDGRLAIRVTVGTFDCRHEDVMVIARTVKELLAP